VWDEAKEQSLLHACAMKIDAAEAQYLRIAKPTTDAMFDHLFAALPEHLREQRATARYYSSSRAGSSKAGSSKVGASTVGLLQSGASKTIGH
jgi:pyruvate dehydrogenase E1 component alpha subunit